MRPRFALVGLLYLALANSAQAVGYGWQELPEGGIEFFFRVEPGLLETYPGAYSELPRGIPEIRRIRVVVSNDKVPNEGTLPKPVAEAAKPPAEEAVPSPNQNGQNPNSEKITGLPPPPTVNMPTGYTDSPQATPIGKHPLSQAFSTRADHEPDKTPDPPNSTAPDKTQQPSIEAQEPTGEPRTGNKIEVPELRPWLPLTGALVALFASLGANAYLAWIHRSLRSNYRSLVARMKGEPAAA